MDDNSSIKFTNKEFANLRHLLDNEVEELLPIDQGNDELIGVICQRWCFRRGIGFFAIRKWQTENKFYELEQIKDWKAKKNIHIAKLIAAEMYQFVTKTFNSLAGFSVTSAPKHKTGFANLIAQELAKLLNIDYIIMFEQKIEPNAKRSIFGDRPSINLIVQADKVLFVDDVVTTGRTLEMCRQLVEGTFIPLIWLYDDTPVI